MCLINIEPDKKRKGFREFLLRRNPSKSFADKYISYLSSRLVKRIARQVSEHDDIYSISTVKQLYDIYHLTKCESTNIRLHNIYSGVISAYIKYINGTELRKMVMHKDDRNG